MNSIRKNAWFVTGTDTGIGKTLVSCAMLHALRGRGLCALGMKPIAAGIDADGTNEDVEQLRAASSLQVDRALVNPYLLRQPIAPHLAAAAEGISLGLPPIRTAFDALAEQADAVVVEGCGGFLVPLDDTRDTADLALCLGLPVVLVVGMRLGCLNHALLTQEAIARRGLTLAGWVANRVDPHMLRLDGNLASLEARIAAPLLGVLPYQTGMNGGDAAKYLTLPR
jgi:dethiobiotin synthetase